MPSTPRLKIPLLAAGQAQKELTHNEALLMLDFLVQASCLAGPSNVPPTVPVEGSAYLCGPAPEGAWADHRDALAFWSASGWRFAAPVAGQKVTEATTGVDWQYLGGTWRHGIANVRQVRVGDEIVLRSSQPAIANPVGGVTIDQEARTAVAAILAAMRNHGLIKVG